MKLRKECACVTCNQFQLEESRNNIFFVKEKTAQNLAYSLGRSPWNVCEASTVREGTTKLYVYLQA